MRCISTGTFNITFFNKTWLRDNFFPYNPKELDGVPINIPRNPNYFLKQNFGDDHMDVLYSSSLNHMTETGLPVQKVYKRYYDFYVEKIINKTGLT